MRSLSSNLGLAIIVLSLLFFPFRARAQDSATTGTLMGTVRDAARASIPGATIALRNLTTNQTRNVTSEADGSYRATALAVGDYEVKAQASGFAPYLNPKVACAQFSPTPTPQASPSPTPSLERRFFKNILRDQRAIWTSPLHLEKEDAKWLAPLGFSTAALIATDRRTAGALHNDRLRLNISRDVAYLGSAGGASSIAGAFYLIGRATHNARARETGLLGGEALIDGGIVAFVIKHATQRRRPRAKEPGDFFEGGLSFPSGHTTTAWSLATVVANEYRHNRLVQVSAYGLAAAASMARFTGRNHFLSDVLVGSAIGYGIGRYVYRTHHDPSLSGRSTQKTPTKQSKLLPLIAPQYDRRARYYGVTLRWLF